MDLSRLISQMTLEEKASLCSGEDFWHLKCVERLGIPEIMVADGPHGLRKQARGGDHLGMKKSVPATCFPTAALLASTWDRELVHSVGQAIAEEALQEQVSVVLGPGANIKRSPLCGRNFEYFSEDPYLTGEIATQHIRGMQSQGVGASLKHFAANNQEAYRMMIDTVVDERALREIYLAGFETAVKQAQPWTVMCAYNQINGTYCSEHDELLNGILREEWGFDGLVVTDWGAINDRVKGLAAGVDLEMPASRGFNDAKIVAAVRGGKLDERVLDRAVLRLLELIFRGQQSLRPDYNYDAEQHHQLARRTASEGMVLLKNAGGLLPLAPAANIAVVGAFAQTPKFQAYGSSMINAHRAVNALDEIRQHAQGSVTYAPGYALNSDAVDPALIGEARAAAAAADVAVVFAGLTDAYESEGFDRQHMRLPDNHNALIQAVAEVNERVVVVLYNGAPVEMPWVGQVQAVLEGYLAGQAVGAATADVLYGRVNPSGKLAETFPLALEDTPAFGHFPEGPVSVEYRESIFVGYRYYDSAGKAVLFPFGHGLSYTSFTYSGLELSAAQIEAGERLQIRFKVKNTGSRAGKEIAQIYVRAAQAGVFRAEQELKGFVKVALEAGEEKRVSVDLDPRAFAVYNTRSRDWTVEPGAYEIRVGASSRDIRLVEQVIVRGAAPALPEYPAAVTASLAKGLIFDEAGFRALVERPLPGNQVDPRQPLTLNSRIDELQHKPLGRIILRLIKKQMDVVLPITGEEGDPQRTQQIMMRQIVFDLPFRSFGIMNEAVNPVMVEGMLDVANGRVLRGIRTFLKGRRINLEMTGGERKAVDF